MFRPGFIRKIQVENFVTYSYVEMHPGPNLNMIIGPNGTGKSTMVAAIVLGLGGNPKTVGRGSKISEYVKHGCDLAKINIHLQGVQENTFIKVTREFDTGDKSSWKLNGSRCSMKDIYDCVKQLNIQVDNLCQFLPQDRVADFAKLNKKELLKQTQSALCRGDLLEKQDSLIQARERHRELLSLSNKHVQSLQEAQDANSKLEGRVKNFEKKMEYKERIADIDRKIAWTEYEEKRSKLGELKNDKTKAQEIYDKYRNEIKPMEREINAHRHSLNDMQHINSKIIQDVRTYECHINTTNEKIEALTAKVREVNDERDMKLAEIEQWNKQIEDAIAKLEDMKKMHQDILTKINQGNDEKRILSNETAKYTNYISQLQDQKEQLEQACIDNKGELRMLETERERIENVKEIRFKQLEKINYNAHAAVLWLRNNKHLFKGEVFEPIMLNLDVLDNAKAKYVEAMIPLRDRLAFTCTDKQDMNLFIRSLRDTKGLSINVVYSGQALENYNEPNIPIERLRQFGFYAYVNTLFTAPEPIMRYLCQTHNLHNIPVGDHSTDNCCESVPKQLRAFFSERFRYAINYSIYSGQKSTRIMEVKGDGSLTSTLDVVRLENIKGKCVDIKRKIENRQSQIENYNAQIIKVEENVKANKQKLLEIQRQQQHANTLKNKIAASQQHLNEMRNKNKNPDVIRTEAKNKIKGLIQTMGLLQDTLKNYFTELETSMTQSALNSVKIEAFRQKIEYMESQIADSKRNICEAEEILAMVTDSYNAARQEATNQLKKAQDMSNGFTPADEGFDAFRENYDRLDSSIEKLSIQKETLISKIACLNTADKREIEDYENRVNQIEALKQNISSVNTDIRKIIVKMARLQEEWLTPLNNLLAAINQKFANAFERMGCAGEVAICQGDNETDYEGYGISIKVTYRRGEPLQELNATVQSGGERAVATAAFMLALQELTPVPFRCVDEINQGMDANNERRIFELIFETTCQLDTSQYFLITPKLVPNLNYSRQVMVHIVHNGPFINADQKWSTSKLCNPQSFKIQ